MEFQTLLLNVPQLKLDNETEIATLKTKNVVIKAWDFNGQIAIKTNDKQTIEYFYDWKDYCKNYEDAPHDGTARVLKKCFANPSQNL